MEAIAVVVASLFARSPKSSRPAECETSAPDGDGRVCCRRPGAIRPARAHFRDWPSALLGFRAISAARAPGPGGAFPRSPRSARSRNGATFTQVLSSVCARTDGPRYPRGATPPTGRSTNRRTGAAGARTDDVGEP